MVLEVGQVWGLSLGGSNELAQCAIVFGIQISTHWYNSLHLCRYPSQTMPPVDTVALTPANTIQSPVVYLHMRWVCCPHSVVSHYYLQ